MWPLANDLGPALVIVALGGLTPSSEPLLFFPLFACLISIVYWRLGLPPRGGYMPFWTGLAACAMGFHFSSQAKGRLGCPICWGLEGGLLCRDLQRSQLYGWLVVTPSTSADNLVSLRLPPRLSVAPPPVFV